MELQEYEVRYFDEQRTSRQVLCLNTPDDFEMDTYELDYQVFYYLTVEETKALLATPIGGTYSCNGGEFEVLVSDE